MRQHPVVGAQMVASIAELEHLGPAIRAEHERWDGRGYPEALAGEAIPLASRITFICDAYHAMTSDRPYRAALSATEAQREVEAHAGTQFDPLVVRALNAVLVQERA
jgi:HD-GYP domain-containing protein (c-di-GMP phosphodiesterase class II)